jgi:hypothetical protein
MLCSISMTMFQVPTRRPVTIATNCVPRCLVGTGIGYHCNLSAKRTNKQHFSEIQRWRFGDRFSGAPPGRSTGQHRSSRSFSSPP